MTGAAFVQPVAAHTGISSYLILRDSEDRWLLWVGDEAEGLIEIPQATATWLRRRPEIEDLPSPRLWFEPSSLPLAEHPLRRSRH